jgi:hypothetical protein
MWLWSLVLVVGSASEVGEGADWDFRTGEPEFVVLVGSGSANPASRYVLLRPKFVIRVMRALREREVCGGRRKEIEISITGVCTLDVVSVADLTTTDDRRSVGA